MAVLILQHTAKPQTHKLDHEEPDRMLLICQNIKSSNISNDRSVFNIPPLFGKLGLIGTFPLIKI